MKKTFTVPRNINRVPIKQWRKWNEFQRSVFNSHYSLLMDSNGVIATNPDKITPRAWKVIAWNAAWLLTDSMGRKV